MNILYIGSAGPLSLIPLQALINSKYAICAVAADKDNNGEFNVINSGSIQSLAFDNSIPLIKLNEKLTDVVLQISSYQPDIILVSCYSRLVPQSILSLAKTGSFNLHPSLLPKFRGPTPLFWQFHEGISDFGITLHRMNAKFDTGNILSQKKVEMHEGINKYDATTLLANAGSNLILGFLNDVSNNNTHEVVQDNALSSYQSYPTENDYNVSTMWTAKRIYNFINAYKGNGATFLCEINKQKIKLLDAYSYQEESYDNMNREEVLLQGDVIKFACQTGYIECQIKTA